MAISSIIVRADKDVKEKLKTTNEYLGQVCSKQNFSFINNSNIDYTALNNSNLHLNSKGTAYLAVNFIKFIRNDTVRKQVDRRQSINDSSYQDFQPAQLLQLGNLLTTLALSQAYEEEKNSESLNPNTSVSDIDSNNDCDIDRDNDSDNDNDSNYDCDSDTVRTTNQDTVSTHSISIDFDTLNSKKGLKIANLNVNSLLKHIDEIRILLSDNPLDILAINESKIDSLISDSELYINNYSIVRFDRNRFGGGVALHIKNIIPYSERKDLVPDKLEMVCIEITRQHSRPLLISTWYRPPNSELDIFNNFELFLFKCDMENKELIL